jgi:FtsZ-binding cell division protein ZapB
MQEFIEWHEYLEIVDKLEPEVKKVVDKLDMEIQELE